MRHEKSPPLKIKRAALWYASNRGKREQAFIPLLRERFGLTVMEAIEAARMAHELTQGGKNVSNA